MQQPAANPYQRPGATVADQAPEEFSEVKILSVAGRLGRVRYIGYSVGMTLLFYLFIAVGAGVSAATGLAFIGGVIIVAAVIGMLVVGIMLTIQRCHDYDVSGWMSLLLVVPMAPLLFWIIPGTKGANRFGDPTPPNSTGVVVLALILPLVFVVGIMAAIALPAYHQYTERARMSQELHKQSQAQGAPVEQANAGEAEPGDAGEEVAGEGSGDEPIQAQTEPASKTEQ